MIQKIIAGAVVGVVTGLATLLITKDINEITTNDYCKAIGLGAVGGAVAGPVLIGKAGISGYGVDIVSPGGSASLLDYLYEQYFCN